MLRFINVEDPNGDLIRINVEHIVAYRSTGEKNTMIFLTNGKTATTLYSPGIIDEMLEHINRREKNNVEYAIKNYMEND